MHLLHPLIRSGQSLPENFPKYFDFSNLRVVELGLEHALQYINYRPLASSIGEAGNLYDEKVAICYDDDGENFALLTIHVSGKLVMYKSGGDKWTVIDDVASIYHDVIFHDGDFYAVDGSGKTVVVDQNGAVLSVTPGSELRGDEKHLVECNGGLLLVDLYLTVSPLGFQHGDEDLEDLVSLGGEMAEKFKVYRLEGGERMWKEVSSLGDMIVFLGDKVAFTANVSDIKVGECRGNCIVFTEFLFNDEIGREHEICVFDLESGSIGPVTPYQGYRELFWPPPSWVYPAVPSVQDQLEQLEI